jgi:hypothetical protein
VAVDLSFDHSLLDLQRKFSFDLLKCYFECVCYVVQIKYFVWSNILLQVFVSDLFENLAIPVKVIPSHVGFDLYQLILQNVELAIQKCVKDVRRMKFQQAQYF